MKIETWDKLASKKVSGRIIQVISIGELPEEHEQWNFSWRKLFLDDPNSLFFKVSLNISSDKAEGLVMLSLVMGEMLVMDNIEIAPENIGNNGRYTNVAGCLLAHSCSLSLNLGKGDYKGYLSFRSKTELIKLYRDKYGAKLAVGQSMFFNPEAGKVLIKKYLGNIDFNYF